MKFKSSSWRQITSFYFGVANGVGLLLSNRYVTDDLATGVLLVHQDSVASGRTSGSVVVVFRVRNSL